MKAVKTLSLFLILMTGYAAFYSTLEKERRLFLADNFIGYTLPSQFAGPMSLEFKGVTSDFLLIKFISFVGKRIRHKLYFEGEQLDFMVKTLDVVTDLDPYFWEAYLFSQMFFSLEGGKYQEANRLLLKAREHLPEDYRIPYYIGFNHYYYLNDSASGAKYIMEASKLPGAPYYLASLGARLATYSFQHRVAIVFLKDMLEQTNNKRALKEFPLRIKTLKIMDTLEHQVAAYHQTKGRFPSSLTELVDSGLLDAIPEDPYGGEFILLENGRVYTTSNMLIQNTAK